MKKLLVSLLVVGMLVIGTGSVWANPVLINQIQTQYPGLTATDVGGNTIEVTETVPGTPATVAPFVYNDDSKKLDITGWTLDWQAGITGMPGGNPPSETEGTLVIVKGNGTLKITDGTVTLPDSSGWKWIMAFEAWYGANIEFGGTAEIIGNNVLHGGIYVNEPGSLTITGGKIDIPRGAAASALTVTVNVPPTSVINGMVIEGEQDSDIADEIKIYGKTIIGAGSRFLHPELRVINLLVFSGGTLDIESGVTWNVRSGETVINEGDIEVNGSLISAGTIINKNGGVLKVNGGQTLDNKGKLVNEGEIIIGPNGKIRNTGTIDNSTGKIDNSNGGLFESVQTAAQMGGDIKGTVTPISTGGGGGGCNAMAANAGVFGAFGAFGVLALATLLKRKKR